jgi:hypothetical protein
MKPQKRNGGIFLLFNIGARWGIVTNATLRPLYPEETCPVLIAQLAGCAPGPKWRGPENLAPTRSDSLYRLSYPGPSFRPKYTPQPLET